MDTADAMGYVVEPLTGTDHSAKNFVMELRYIISGLLDGELMLNALCNLIENKWHYAGARVHKRPNGHLELQIPQVFDDGCPPVLFDVYDADKETPLSSCFKRFPDVDPARERPTFFEDVMETTPMATKLLHLREPTSANGKRCASSSFGQMRLNLDHFLQSGGPMLTAVLYCFPHSSETVVSVIFPHVMFDAGGMADFIRAWSSAVSNSDLDSIPEVLPLRDAPRQMLSWPNAPVVGQGENAKTRLSRQTGKQQVAPGHYPKTASAVFLIVVGIFWRNFLLPLMHRLKPRRMRSIQIWIPQVQLDAWRSEAMLQRPANMSPDSISFLSDNDLITAWATWLLAQKRNSWLYGSFSAPLPVNMRVVEPQSRAALQIKGPHESSSKTLAAQTAGKVILHNWLSLVTFSAKWLDVSRGSKWQVAWALRQKVNATLNTPAGVQQLCHTLATLNNVSVDESGHPSYGGGVETLPAPPSHEMLIVSNWTQLNFLSAANFGNAVIPGSARDKGGDGTASQMYGLGHPVAMRVQSRPFPQVIVYYKQPKDGVLASLNVDEDLVASGLFGEGLEA